MNVVMAAVVTSGREDVDSLRYVLVPMSENRTRVCVDT